MVLVDSHVQPPFLQALRRSYDILLQFPWSTPLDDDVVHIYLAGYPHQSCKHLRFRHRLEVWGCIQHPLRNSTRRKQPLLSDDGESFLALIVHQYLPKKNATHQG